MLQEKGGQGPSAKKKPVWRLVKVSWAEPQVILVKKHFKFYVQCDSWGKIFRGHYWISSVSPIIQPLRLWNYNITWALIIKSCSAPSDFFFYADPHLSWFHLGYLQRCKRQRWCWPMCVWTTYHPLKGGWPLIFALVNTSYLEHESESVAVPWCPTLCKSSPSGSSVHGISQARILELVAISSSKGSFWPRYWTWVSCIAGRLFTVWVTREAHLDYNAF